MTTTRRALRWREWCPGQRCEGDAARQLDKCTAITQYLHHHRTSALRAVRCFAAGATTGAQVGKSKKHERHMFPSDDARHTASQWCRCRPKRRQHGIEVVYVHVLIAEPKWAR